MLTTDLANAVADLPAGVVTATFDIQLKDPAQLDAVLRELAYVDHARSPLATHHVRVTVSPDGVGTLRAALDQLDRAVPPVEGRLELTNITGRDPGGLRAWEPPASLFYEQRVRRVLPLDGQHALWGFPLAYVALGAVA